MPTPIWRKLLRHCVRLAFSLARPSAGNNIAARMAMIAMTTSNSISVKPGRCGGDDFMVTPKTVARMPRPSKRNPLFFWTLKPRALVFSHAYFARSMRTRHCLAYGAPSPSRVIQMSNSDGHQGWLFSPVITSEINGPSVGRRLEISNAPWSRDRAAFACARLAAWIRVSRSPV